MPTHTGAHISAKQKLRTRIKKFYRHLEQADWHECFKFVDPQLRQDRIDYQAYAKSLSSFSELNGPIKFLSIAKLVMYEGEKVNQLDKRDFAYGVVVWEDRLQMPHVMRQRWVRSGSNWYTRMLGLTAKPSASKA